MAISINKGITAGIKDDIQYNKLTNKPGIFDNDQNNTRHGAYHLAGLASYFEPRESDNFEFVVTDINNLTRAGVNAGANKSLKFGAPNTAQERLRLSVVKASVPHFKQSPIEVKRGNSRLKYAGVPEFKSGSLEINDFIGADTKSILMAWQKLSYDVTTEKVGLAQDYKKDCYLIEYSPHLQLVRRWRLHGCWISELNEGDYNAEDNSKKTISATIEYDSAELDNSDLTA